MRLKPAQIVVIAVALGAGGLAAMLMGDRRPPAPAPQQAAAPAPTIQTVEVLVAAVDLPLGKIVAPGEVVWRRWPEEAGTGNFVVRRSGDAGTAAMDEVVGSIVRTTFVAGEPIRPARLVKGNRGFMSAILTPGMRAIAAPIDDPSRGAGAFILPNDRVDVIMVRKSPEGSYITETVLSNVRVLAIDQQIQENEDGSKSAIGTTATLELTPDQTKVIAVAQQMAERLSLALRSIADAQEADTGAADYLLSGGDGMPIIQVIKTGEIVNGGEPAAQK